MIKIMNTEVKPGKINNKSIKKIIINKKQVWHEPEWHVLWEGHIIAGLDSGSVKLEGEGSSSASVNKIDNSNYRYIKSGIVSDYNYKARKLKFRISWTTAVTSPSVVTNGYDPDKRVLYTNDFPSEVITEIPSIENGTFYKLQIYSSFTPSANKDTTVGLYLENNRIKIIVGRYGAKGTFELLNTYLFNINKIEQYY